MSRVPDRDRDGGDDVGEGARRSMHVDRSTLPCMVGGGKEGKGTGEGEGEGGRADVGRYCGRFHSIQ